MVKQDYKHLSDKARKNKQIMIINIIADIGLIISTLALAYVILKGVIL